MHMTLEADYAVRIVEFLAEQGCENRRSHHRGANPGSLAVRP